MRNMSHKAHPKPLQGAFVISNIFSHLRVLGGVLRLSGHNKRVISLTFWDVCRNGIRFPVNIGDAMFIG